MLYLLSFSDMEEISKRLYELALNTPTIRSRVDRIIAMYRERMLNGELVHKGYTQHSDEMRDMIKSAKRIVNTQDKAQVHRSERQEAAKMLTDYIFEEAQKNIKLKQGYNGKFD